MPVTDGNTVEGTSAWENANRIEGAFYAKGELEHARAVIRTLRSDAAADAAEISALYSQVEVLQKEKNELAAHKARAVQRLQEVCDKKNSLEEKMTNQQKSESKQVEQLENHVEELEDQVRQQKNEIRQFKAELKELKAEQKQTAKATKKQQDKDAKLIQDLHKAKEKDSRLIQDLHKANEKLSERNTKLQEAGSAAVEAAKEAVKESKAKGRGRRRSVAEVVQEEAASLAEKRKDRRNNRRRQQQQAEEEEQSESCASVESLPLEDKVASQLVISERIESPQRKRRRTRTKPQPEPTSEDEAQSDEEVDLTAAKPSRPVLEEKEPEEEVILPVKSAPQSKPAAKTRSSRRQTKENVPPENATCTVAAKSSLNDSISSTMSTQSTRRLFNPNRNKENLKRGLPVAANGRPQNLFSKFLSGNTVKLRIPKLKGRS